MKWTCLPNCRVNQGTVEPDELFAKLQSEASFAVLKRRSEMKRIARTGILFKLFACAAIASAMLFFSTPARAQDTPCAFDDASLSYRGTPLEQARCLLRPVLVGGHLGPQM